MLIGLKVTICVCEHVCALSCFCMHTQEQCLANFFTSLAHWLVDLSESYVGRSCVCRIIGGMHYDAAKT